MLRVACGRFGWASECYIASERGKEGGGGERGWRGRCRRDMTDERERRWKGQEVEGERKKREEGRRKSLLKNEMRF